MSKFVTVVLIWTLSFKSFPFLYCFLFICHHLQFVSFVCISTYTNNSCQGTCISIPTKVYMHYVETLPFLVITAQNDRHLQFTSQVLLLAEIFFNSFSQCTSVSLFFVICHSFRQHTWICKNCVNAIHTSCSFDSAPVICIVPASIGNNLYMFTMHLLNLVAQSIC